MNEQLLFIDFEASSLGSSSYPIEVAWSLEDGSIESHLINPCPISEWTDWSVDSEAVHQISRNQLLEEGKHPKWVAERMNDTLNSKVLLSNAYEFDLDWCDTLFRAAEEEMTFKIGCSHHVFSRHIAIKLKPSIEDVILDRKVQKETIDKYLNEIAVTAWENLPERHRAAVDVEQLIRMWALIKKL